MKIRRNSGSVNWLAVPGEGMSAEALNEFIEKNKLTIKPVVDNYFAPTRYGDYYNQKGNFAYLINGENVITIYCVLQETTGNKRDIGVSYIPKKYTIKLNEDDVSAANGKDAFDYINQQFKDMYGVSIRVAFGYSPEMLPCIPAPLNYGKINPDTIRGFYKADVSSAYATEACGDLPTMKESKSVVGMALPTEEFPFAFYPKEGKFAVYGEGKYMHDVPLVAEYTVLCRKCEYSFRPILQDLYNKKEAEKDPAARQYYKDILNYFVGWLHWRPKDKKTGKYAEKGSPEYNPNCPRFAAVAAIIKARCNARMLSLKEEIEKTRGNQVVLINTDAVGWTGYDMPHLYTTEKALGNLVLEHKNAQALILGSKKYQILDKDGTLTTKWAGVRKETTRDMKWGDILKAAGLAKKKEWSWQEQKIIYKEYF